MHQYDDGYRGAAVDQWAEEDKRPYTFEGFVADGDELLDHTDAGDGELAEYSIDSHEEMPANWYTETLGAHRVSEPVRCECEATGDAFAIGTVPAGAPMTCPVCGADGSKDDVDTCTDAHGASGTSQDTDDRDDRQDGQDNGPAQATLTGYTEAGN
jgi:hypothetical protein